MSLTPMLRQTLHMCLIILASAGCVSLFAGKTDRGTTGIDRELRKKSTTLDSIKTELDKRRKKIRELEKAEGNYLARLEYLETNIIASRRYLVILSGRIDTAETTITWLTDSLRHAQVMLTDRQTVMKQRLRNAYMTGTVSPLVIMLLSKNPLDLIHRVRYLDDVHQYDRELLGKINKTRQSIDEKKQAFENERATLAALLRAKTKEQTMLLKEEGSRRSILSDIQTKKKSNISLVSELEASQRALNTIIRLLEQKRKSAEKSPTASFAPGKFTKQKGKIPWPLNGSILANYGRIVHPRYHTITMNNGIDIGARPGSPVTCVAPGIVIYTGSMRGLGRLVIVDHGASLLSIYANLGSFGVEANQQVVAGTPLGTTGGEGRDGILHFEIRKSTESMDPLLWLERK